MRACVRVLAHTRDESPLPNATTTHVCTVVHTRTADPTHPLTHTQATSRQARPARSRAACTIECNKRVQKKAK